MPVRPTTRRMARAIVSGPPSAATMATPARSTYAIHRQAAFTSQHRPEQPVTMATPTPSTTFATAREPAQARRSRTRSATASITTAMASPMPRTRAWSWCCARTRSGCATGRRRPATCAWGASGSPAPRRIMPSVHQCTRCRRSAAIPWTTTATGRWTRTMFVLRARDRTYASSTASASQSGSPTPMPIARYATRTIPARNGPSVQQVRSASKARPAPSVPYVMAPASVPPS